MQGLSVGSEGRAAAGRFGLAGCPFAFILGEEFPPPRVPAPSGLSLSCCTLGAASHQTPAGMGEVSCRWLSAPRGAWCLRMKAFSWRKDPLLETTANHGTGVPKGCSGSGPLQGLPVGRCPGMEMGCWPGGPRRLLVLQEDGSFPQLPPVWRREGQRGTGDLGILPGP